MKFSKAKKSKVTQEAAAESHWGPESDAPDLLADHLAEETLRIQREDIRNSFDGLDWIDADEKIDMWGESTESEAYTGPVELSEVEEDSGPTEVLATDGFTFGEELGVEFGLAGPTNSEKGARRANFSFIDIEDDVQQAAGATAAEAEENSATGQVSTAYALSFSKYAQVDHKQYNIPEPIPARVAVNS